MLERSCVAKTRKKSSVRRQIWSLFSRTNYFTTLILFQHQKKKVFGILQRTDMEEIASGMDHKTFQNCDLSQQRIASAQRINSGHYVKCCSAAGSNPGIFGWIFWTLNWCLILVQMEQLGGLKRNFLPMGLHQLQMAPLVLDTSLLCFSPF